MKRHRVLGALSLLSLSLAAGTTAPATTPSKAAARTMLGPLGFVTNQGQSAPQARFTSSTPSGSLIFEAKGMELAIPVSQGAGKAPKAERVSLHFAGARPDAALNGELPQATHTNFMKGSDPAKWQLDVPTFAKLRYQDLYPGTDLVCYGKDAALEYDWVLKPGADPSRIQLAFDQVRSLKVDAQGNLVARTAHGEVRQAPPVAYQDIDGQRRPVQARFQVKHGHKVGFTLGAYDRSHELVIDPTLSWSATVATGSAPSTTGGTYEIENTGGVVVASNGDVIIAWADYTEPVGDGQYNGRVRLKRINSTNTSTIYDNTYGGASFTLDYVYGLTVDSSGNAYVMGNTNDTSFPVTHGSLSGYTWYVLKANSVGSTVYSSLFGSNLATNQGQAVGGLAVDSGGNAFVCGTDYTGNVPTTGGAFQTAHYNDDTKNGIDGIGNAHGDDAWVAKLDPSTGAITAATYLGGDDWEGANALAIDSSDNVIVVGETCSSNLATGGAYQTTHGDNEYVSSPAICYNYNGFVAKLSNSLASRTWCSYLGGKGGPNAGNGFDNALAVTTDGSGNVIVALSAQSTDIAATGSAFQSTHGSDSGGNDIFVAKLNSAGTTLLAGTYLGGTGTETVDHIAVDGTTGTICLTGTTTSSNFPSVHQLYSAYDTTNGSPYLVHLKGDATSVRLATNLGGTGPLPLGASGVMGFAHTTSGDTYAAAVNATFSNVAVKLAKFANTAPSLSAGTILPKIQQGGSLTVTLPALTTATSPSDGDGDDFTLVFEGVNSGTLTDNSDNPAVAGVTTLTSGQHWTWTPPPASHGTALAAFTVSGDDAHLTSTPVQVSAYVNAPPSLSAIGTQTMEAGAATPFDVAFTVSDAETAAGSLGISPNSTNTTLLPNANVTISNSAGSGTVHVTPVSGQLGTSTISLTVTDADGGISSGSFDFTVHDTTAPNAGTPSVTGTTGTITLADTTATDLVGVTKIELYIDGNLVASANAATISTGYDSSLLGNGSHTLVAKAYDSSSNVGTSSGVSFSVSNVDVTPPSLSNLAETGTSGTISFSITATDPNGVSKVSYYIDGIGLLSSTTPPFTCTLDAGTLANGAHTVSARAWDAANNRADLGPVGFTISNPVDAVAPTVSVSESGTSGTITFSASASDNVGVQKVLFFLDNVGKATNYTAPYGFSMDSTTLAEGDHIITAKAFDASGNSALSSQRFTISNTADNTPPVVSGLSVSSATGTALISATVTDNVAISRVLFFIDNVGVATDYNAPYQFSFDTHALSNGTHSLTVKAFDAAGNNAKTYITFPVSN